jgi:hypothetical protein
MNADERGYLLYCSTSLSPTSATVDIACGVLGPRPPLRWQFHRKGPRGHDRYCIAYGFAVRVTPWILQ